MIWAEKEPLVDRCLEVAREAFNLSDTVDAHECGGISADRHICEESEAREGSSVKITLKYKYKPECGLSDRTYHVVEPDKVREDVFVFDNGSVTVNGKPLKFDAFFDVTKDMVKRFFDECSDVIKVA